MSGWVEKRTLDDRLVSAACTGPSLPRCVRVRMSVPGGPYPGGVHRWRHRGGAGGSGDLSDDSKGLFQGSVFVEHFLSVLLLLR